MEFPNRLSRRIEVKIGGKEAIAFIIFLLSLGIISAIKPFYTLIILIGLTLLTIGALNPKKAFLGMGIFLIFQAAIIRNMTNLGTPEEIINIIKRIDEFIWVLFIAYIALHNYMGNTWKFKKTNLDSFAIIFAGIGIISTFVNHNSIFWSLIAIFLSLKGFIMYWTTVNLNIERSKIIMFFKVVIYILIFAAFIGIMQFFRVPLFQFGESERFGLAVAHSIFAHHGVFGSLMAVGIALAIGLTLGTGEIKWLFPTILFTFGLISSSVRRSLVGLLFGLLFVFLNRKKFKIPQKYIYLFFSLFIVFLTLFGGRIGKIIESTKFEYGVSIQPRYWLYYGGYKIFKNKPLLGEGPGKYGSFISVLRKSRTYMKYDIIIDDHYKMDAYWASVVGEYGIFGLLTTIILLLILFQGLLKNFYKSNKRPFMRGLYIGFIILFIDFVIESITSPVYLNSLTQFILFAGIGFLVSTENGESVKY